MVSALDCTTDVSLGITEELGDTIGTVAPVLSGMDVETVEPSEGEVCDSYVSLGVSAEEDTCSVVGVVLVAVGFGTGIAVVPSVPVCVLNVYEGAVFSAPADGAGVPMVVPGVTAADVVVSSVVPCVGDASDAREDAALERTDEYSEANEEETSGLVAVATMLDN